MVDHNVVLLLYRNTLALFCAASIAVSPVADSSLRGAIATKQSIKGIASVASGNLAMTDERIPSVVRNDKYEIDSLANTRLWQYLRTGINYLEASGRDVPIHYKHPGGKAYGPLALTPIAIKDVKLHYPELSGYAFRAVLSDRKMYEKFASAYADLLLRHYLKMDYINMPKEAVFEALQRAWFLGPTLYKSGHTVIASRQKRAAEYIDSPRFII